ncbi:MAG: phosphoribosylglycinamide formyltransferase [Vampirovibrionales bacterium]|nr:phosphoribosylglycinamide formyltransferase [Vampirovibrionales bacterium]
MNGVRLGVLLSGRGSNLVAIADAIDAGRIPGARIALTLSNRPSAPGVLIAEERGLPTAVLAPKAYDDREAYDRAVCDALRDQGVELVVLAGYDRILTPGFIRAFAGRILNIHPSLLPAYGGKGMVGERVHEAVLAAGETQSGCTAHLVTEAVDEGPILGRRVVDVLPGDTPQTLAARILREEHQLYPLVIAQAAQRLAQGEAIVADNFMAESGRPL